MEDIVNMLAPRFKLGKDTYGHGVRVYDSYNWKTMALEEILDAIVYVVADYVKSVTPEHTTEDNNNIIEVLKNINSIHITEVRERVKTLVNIARELSIESNSVLC